MWLVTFVSHFYLFWFETSHIFFDCGIENCRIALVAIEKLNVDHIDGDLYDGGHCAISII